MVKISSKLNELSDEEILDAFVKRFKCDGAILIYFESDTEYGFGRWRNSVGRKWVDGLFKNAQENNYLPITANTKKNLNKSIIQ